MSFIQHIIEPKKLLLAWQSSDENKPRTRYLVAELNRIGDEISLTYLTESKDFQEAKKLGFESYPAFQEINKTHHNVLDAFMRRLPPRSRGDFQLYMKGLRLKADDNLSEFALLGYSGAKLPSDGFSIVHPFDNVDSACELLLEAVGFRHIQKNHNDIKINDPVSFEIEENNAYTNERAVRILVGKKHIGYINRGLLANFIAWINNGRIIQAWVEKVNGTPGKPAVYIFVKVSAATQP